MAAPDQAGEERAGDTRAGVASIPFEHVLVPVDEARIDEAALEDVLPMFEAGEATIHVLHVTPEPAFGSTTRDRLRHDPQTHLAEIGEAFEEKFGDRVGTVRVEHREGIPHEEILHYVDANGIDLIVMAPRGRSGLGLLVKGSTTQRVIAETGVPVLEMNREPPGEE